MVISDALPVQFWSVLTDTYNERNYDGMHRKCFCAPWQADDIIRIQVDFEFLDALYLKIYDADDTLIQTLSFTNTVGTVYTVSFSPSTYNITDEQIRLSIFRGTTEIFKSDCLEVMSDADETVLIEYSSNRNLASINYSDVSPDPEFYLRIPAIFYHEKHPQEREVIELSNSRAVQLNAQVKAQRLLKVKDMPPYMHRKLILVLMHQFVTIDLQEWVKEEEYEEILSSNPRWPLYKAQCWLTEKDYIMRSVL